jgi:hypothetical protein
MTITTTQRHTPAESVNERTSGRRIDAVQQFVSFRITETGNTDAAGKFTLTHTPIGSLSRQSDTLSRINREPDLVALTADDQTLYTGEFDQDDKTIELYTDAAKTTSAENLAGVKVSYWYYAPIKGTLNDDGTFTPEAIITPVDSDGNEKFTDANPGAVQLTGSILDKVDLSNQLLASINHGQLSPIAISSWQEIQYIVRSGLADKVFRVGDQFISSYDTGEVVWDVIGINHDIPTDKKYIYSLTLQAHNCIMNCQFDAPEALYYAEEELPAGEQVVTLNNEKYKFTTGQAVPEGGQVVIASWQSAEGDGRYVPTKITTYEADRTTVIESGLDVTSIESGEDTLSPVNDHSRCRYGSNNYKESAIRQWLNSEESSFTWAPKTNFDRPPTGAPYTGAGFLKLLDPELVSVLGAVDKQVTRNTITDGGGQDLFSDKVFLLSRVEVFGGTEGTTTGEQAYPYYSALATNPTTDALAGRIKYLDDAARTWWLRSPYPGNADSPRIVYASGTVGYYSSASYAIGAAPACCIV